LPICHGAWRRRRGYRARRGFGEGLAGEFVHGVHVGTLPGRPSGEGPRVLCAAPSRLRRPARTPVQPPVWLAKGGSGSRRDAYSRSSGGTTRPSGSTARRPAISTAWVRLPTPSLRRTAVTCALIVASDTPRS